MKNKLFISVSLAIAALCSIAPSAFGQSLKGSLKDLTSDKLIVVMEDAPNLSNSQRVDTIPVTNGRFTYNLKIKTPTRVYLSPLYKPTKDKKMVSMNRYLETIAVPGEQAVLSGTFEKFQLSGSAFFREYQKAHAPLDNINEKLNALYKKYDPFISVEHPSDSIVAQFSKERTALFDAQKKEILSYIKNHPDSDVSTALVSELGMKDMKEGVALLTQRAKDGKLSPIYKRILKQAQEQKDKEERSKNMEGKPAPTFSLPGLDGKMISLESFHGKYVVVDFWGSWCGWCIKGIPDMKKYYDKYKDKMEIISVDCRDTEAKWREAVTKYGLAWTQVRCDGTSCNVPTLYNILGYPTKCIIDPQGTLVKTVIGESPEFYEYLDKVFK
jgi:thiol-disulfide isomerase/thioredoxin